MTFRKVNTDANDFYCIFGVVAPKPCVLPRQLTNKRHIFGMSVSPRNNFRCPKLWRSSCILGTNNPSLKPNNCVLGSAKLPAQKFGNFSRTSLPVQWLTFAASKTIDYACKISGRNSKGDVVYLPLDENCLLKPVGRFSLFLCDAVIPRCSPSPIVWVLSK